MIKAKTAFLLISVLCLAGASICMGATYERSNVEPPKVNREFRGLWVATVGNIDWPSKPGLSTAAQKAELISLLDRAKALKLNAIIFQVRPACDAMYASKIEPWSEYLTAGMGKAPSPFYDPLEFAISEAHKRGLELHAWFNPYRALHKSHEGSVAPNHVSRKHPQWVKRFGQYLWLDPGEREVQDYSLSVIMDVVKRYDIDAVHFDDYFYPDPAEARIPFPDDPSWKKFGAGGKLSRDDWRRQNINTFIERTYRSIKNEKPWVKFGISPHGIWRPGYPSQIRGFDTYALLAADTRKWLADGWLDYFSPQLYWTIASKEQSFPVLLNWWAEQNVRNRHLWPGLSAAYALSNRGWDPYEIPNQIALTRKHPNVSGYLVFSSSKLFTNAPLVDKLRRQVQLNPAIVPASPWLSSVKPARPSISVTGNAGTLQLTMRSGSTNVLRWWLVQQKVYNDWQTSLLSAQETSFKLNGTPEYISVTAIDRFGTASSPAVLQIRKPQQAPRASQR
jgi:Uncharacterized protein conserved in bacteria